MGIFQSYTRLFNKAVLVILVLVLLAVMEQKKESHKFYSVSFKLKVIAIAEVQGNHKASKLFNVDRKRVREWRKSKDSLLLWTKSRKRAPGAGRSVRYADIDQKLIRWFTERREQGVRVTGKALKQEALRLHKEGGSQSFKASCGWFRSFKMRHNISFRRTTHIAQKSVEITDGLIDRFLQFVIRMRRLRDYDLSNIGNMDETPVYLEMPGKATYDIRGQGEITVKSTGREKEKYTVTLAAFADGTKISPLVHLPGVRPLPKSDIPNGIVVYMCGAGKKSWANEESILFWLKKLWGKNNVSRRMLVWDAFRGHLTTGVKQYLRNHCNTDMCVIPGGCTSRLQPADVSWNKPFKSRFSELYDEWLFSGPVERTAKGNRKAPPKPLILQWIKTSWDSITPETIRKSFKKCGISVAMDGSEDHLFGQIASDQENSAEEFDGFEQGDVDMAQEVFENVNCQISEESAAESDGDSHQSETDCDSPGR